MHAMRTWLLGLVFALCLVWTLVGCSSAVHGTGESPTDEAMESAPSPQEPDSRTKGEGTNEVTDAGNETPSKVNTDLGGTVMLEVNGRKITSVTKGVAYLRDGWLQV